MSTDVVLFDRLDADLALITLNRPHRLNAIDDSFIAGLHNALDQLEDAPDVRGAVLTGSSERFRQGGAQAAPSLGDRLALVHGLPWLLG